MSSARDPSATGGFLRPPHGTAKARGNPGPRVEIHPPGELPNALPDQRPQPSKPKGRFFTTENAAIYGARGGALAKGRPSLASSLGISGDLTPSAQAFDPYRRRAASFRRAHTSELAALAGGQCGTGPSSMVATAALQLAASRYLYDVATQGEGPPDAALLREARQQGDSARQNLLAAFELAIREGRARGTDRPGTYDPDEVTRRAEAEAEEKRAKRRLPQTIEAKGEG